MINRIHSLPFVNNVIPNFRASVTVQAQSESKSDAILFMNPDRLEVIASTLEYTDGSIAQPSNLSSMIVAQNVTNPPGDANSFLVIGRNVKITYSFVDPSTGQLTEESKNFIVTGIMKVTGNPTIDNGIVINLQAITNTISTISVIHQLNNCIE